MTSTSSLVMMARVSGSLVVVLTVAVLAARLARRAVTRGGRGTTLAVRERIGLTRETSAVVLEAGDRLLLLGVSAQQVTVLADLRGATTVVAAPLVAAPLVAAPARPFQSQPPQTPPFQAQPQHAVQHQLTRRQLREAGARRRTAPAVPTQRGSGAVLDPRTWQQGLEALRDLTARRG